MALDMTSDYWETEDDAQALERAEAVKNDPVRLAKAKERVRAKREALRENIKAAEKALGITPKFSKHNNPATIKSGVFRLN